MPPSPEISPLSGEAHPAPKRTRTSWWRRLSPLGRDIVVILALKAVVLLLLWYAFFRSPAAVHMTMDPRQVEQNLIHPATVAGEPHAHR